MHCRKLIAFVFIIILWSSAANAQRFKAGVSGGMLASDVIGLDLVDGDTDFNKAGFTFGGLVNTNLSPKNSLQMEIYFIQKGSYQPPDSTYSYYYKISLDYIEVALLYKHRIPVVVNQKPLDRVELEAGPSFGERLRISEEGYSAGNPGANYESPYTSSDFGINFGISYFFSENFYFNFRYFSSIIPVAKHSVRFNDYFFSTFNNGDNVALMFTLKYLFGKEEQKSEK